MVGSLAFCDTPSLDLPEQLREALLKERPNSLHFLLERFQMSRLVGSQFAAAAVHDGQIGVLGFVATAA